MMGGHFSRKLTSRKSFSFVFLFAYLASPPLPSQTTIPGLPPADSRRPTSRLPLSPGPHVLSNEDKCDTWVFQHIVRNWGMLNDETKNSLRRTGFLEGGMLDRPVGLDSSRSTPHFVVHYTTAEGDTNAISAADGDGNGTPDYIDRLAGIPENVWEAQVAQMDYVSPSPDSRGGDDRYDVYLYRLRTGLYGYVAPETYVGDNPNSADRVELNAYASYMVLRNNCEGFVNPELANLQVTAAHEFFHSLQFGYDGYEAAWVMEATATWMEDELFDDVNDNYAYLEDWFGDLGIPLDATESEAKGHWYGSWLFFRYLSEHHGGAAIIRELWDWCAVFDSRGADYRSQDLGRSL